MAHSQIYKSAEVDAILSELWNKDENRCINGQDYEIEMQGYIRSTRSRRDVASENFFEEVKPHVFERPTYKLFLALLDNYEMKTGVPERLTDEELKENRDFLDEIMKTEVMQLTKKFLAKHYKHKQYNLSEEYDFKCFLYDMWFKFYRRTKGKRIFDSSGFEHVFVGELRGDDILGLHNWLQIYTQEKAGLINYRGFFKWGTDDVDDPRLVALQFAYQGGADKDIGSSFLGTSPELELAMYTICFCMIPNGYEKIAVQLEDDLCVDFTIHKFGDQIGTAFPGKHRDRKY